MSSQPDIAVYGADRQLLLVVEVKRMAQRDRQWAARFHQNLLDHEAVPPAPFFLLVLLDQLYLWADHGSAANALPDYQADTHVALKRYLPEPSALGADISELGLELAVRSWLSDLISGTPCADDATQWLAASGLSTAIREGTIAREAFA